MSHRLIELGIRSVSSLALVAAASAQTPDANPDSTDTPKDAWYVNESHGPADTLRFEVNEATWVSVDVHPAGRTLVIDILGDLYTLPISGGEATRVTSGPAWDFQPRWSTDGNEILFTSDRGGTDNIWVMLADGSAMRPLTTDKDKVCNSASMSPDGQNIVYKKRFTDRSSIGRTELWLSSTLGGSGFALTDKEELAEINEPVFSPDGRFVYYAARPSRYQYNRNVYAGIYQIRRFDRETGNTTTLTDGYGGSGRPTPSPDGKSLAFVRRDRLTSVLYLFDLERLTERPLWNGLSKDMQENFAWTGTYPGMAFTPDGQSIVVWARGKLWRVATTSGDAREIPFRAPVEQSVDHALRWPRSVAPDSLRLRMLAWPTLSPDGRSLTFAAIGRLWHQSVPRAATSPAPPSRIVLGDAKPLPTRGGLAYAPAYSADGKRLAYVSWNDREGGHVWTMPASGGASKRVTSIPSQYVNPAFSPDGTKLAVLRGNNAAYRGRDVGDDSFHDIVWLPASGSASSARYVISIGARGSSRRMPRIFWNATGDRIYYIESEDDEGEETTRLSSVKLDGTDIRTHATWKGAEEIVPSPDGRWVAFRQAHNAYLAALPLAGWKSVDLSGSDGPVPAHQFSKDGGEWLNWSDGGRTVTWSFGPDVFRASVDSVVAHFRKRQNEIAEKADPSAAKKDTTAAKSPKDEAKEGGDDAHPVFRVDTLSVNLVVPRAKPRGSYAVVGARLITMKGSEVIEDGTLLVKDNRIEAVGRRGDVPIPEGLRIFDATGTTLIPGLIDTHAHLHYNTMDILPEEQWANWCNLAYGVTTTHDPSASTYAVFTESEMIEAGVMHGPRTYSTGYILYGAKDPNGATVNSLDDAKDHVRRLKRLGAFSVKSYMQPRREQRQWIIEAAREESVLVVPEGGGNLEMNLSMVVDGHTSIEHSLPVAPIYDDVARLFGGSRTVETPTLLVSYGGLSGEHWFYQHHEVWKNEKLLRFTPRGELDARAIRRPVMTIDGDWHHMDVARGCKKILDAGGRVSLGAHGQLQGLGPHWELWALTHGGITPHEALRCATLTGAWELGFDAELGSLEPGKLADFVVLEKNPLEKIEHSDSARWVVKNGELWEAATMDKLWPQPMPCHEFTWKSLGSAVSATGVHPGIE
jgi:Tol biopolymer transport system component/imidazolonepropionase-like amidohydrolase